MTCIIGLVDKNGDVYFGADSRVTNDWWKQSLCRFPKIWRSGSFLIGTTGYLRLQQLLRFKLALPKQKKQSDMAFMCVDFSDAIRKCLKDSNYAKEKDNVNDFDGQILVGYHGQVYTIEENYQIGNNVRRFAACGCGADFAYGSLETNSKAQPLPRIREALRVAAEFSAGVSPPFKILKLPFSKK